MTPRGPPRTPLGVRATRAAQQATRRPGLQPLAILHSSLAPRHRLEVACGDEVHLEPPRRQNLVHGNPRHPGRRPRHRLNPAGVPPGGPRLEVRGTGPERPHRLGGAVLRHTGPDRLAADLQAGGVRGDTGARVGAWRSRAADTPGEASMVKGSPCLQTRSGPLERSGSTGSSLRPSDATSQHLTPDQNQFRQRAVLHTSRCTVVACLNAGHQYTLLRPRFCQQAYCVAVWNSRHNYLAHRHFW
jgi:hypothetical protein